MTLFHMHLVNNEVRLSVAVNRSASNKCISIMRDMKEDPRLIEFD